MRSAVLVPALVWLLCACSLAPPLSQENWVRETVLRYPFEHNASGIGDAAVAYFLRVGGGDPSTAFAGYEEASESGASNQYLLERRAGSWRVVACLPGWIR